MQQSLFSCLGAQDSETVVYLAVLNYTILPGVVDVPSLLSSWVDSGPAIRVNFIQLQVDTTCPVAIDSLKPESCTVVSPGPPTDTPTDPPTDVTVTAVVVCVILLLVVVAIVAAIVIAVVVFRRKQSKSKYRYVPTPDHLIQMTVSCWVTGHALGTLWWCTPQ